MKLLVIGKQRAPFAVAIRELEKQGVEVVYQEADLENVHGVEASFMCIDEERGSIEGVRYIKAPECYVEPDLFRGERNYPTLKEHFKRKVKR